MSADWIIAHDTFVHAVGFLFPHNSANAAKSDSSSNATRFFLSAALARFVLLQVPEKREVGEVAFWILDDSACSSSNDASILRSAALARFLLRRVAMEMGFCTQSGTISEQFFQDETSSVRA